MKVLDYKWFCGRTNVGIVKVETDFEGIKYYIAAVEGLDEMVDVNFIASWGSSFPKDAGAVLFGDV
jgi:hypothetical protein